MSLRVLIVNNNIEFLESAANLLRLQPNVEQVCCAVSGSDALEQMPQFNPNLVLIHWFLPARSGLELTRVVKAQTDPPYVVILSPFDLSIYREVALEAGADGLICTTDWNAELFALLEQLGKASAEMTNSVEGK